MIQIFIIIHKTFLYQKNNITPSFYVLINDFYFWIPYLFFFKWNYILRLKNCRITKILNFYFVWNIVSVMCFLSILIQFNLLSHILLRFLLMTFFCCLILYFGGNLYFSQSLCLSLLTYNKYPINSRFIST